LGQGVAFASSLLSLPNAIRTAGTWAAGRGGVAVLNAVVVSPARALAAVNSVWSLVNGPQVMQMSGEGPPSGGPSDAPASPNPPSGSAGGSGDTVDLYRAVGVRELDSVTRTGRFVPAGNSLEGRQFAFTLEEALEYAQNDPSKVAVLRATISRNAPLSEFDYSTRIDPHIFRNGVITVQPGPQSDLFHRALQAVEQVF